MVGDLFRINALAESLFLRLHKAEGQRIITPIRGLKFAIDDVKRIVQKMDHVQKTNGSFATRNPKRNGKQLVAASKSCAKVTIKYMGWEICFAICISSTSIC